MESVESSSTQPSAAGAGRSRRCFVKPLPVPLQSWCIGVDDFMSECGSVCVFLDIRRWKTVAGDRYVLAESAALARRVLLPAHHERVASGLHEAARDV